MRSLVNRWSPLTHASQFMTASRPATATLMRARVSPSMHPKIFSCWMPFLPQPSRLLDLMTSSEYADLHTVRLEFPIMRYKLGFKRFMTKSDADWLHSWKEILNRKNKQKNNDKQM